MSTIPLPPRNGEVRKSSSRRRWFDASNPRWRRRRRGLKIGGLALGFLTAVGVAAVLVVVIHFHGVAGGFDLAEMERTEPGSQLLDKNGRALGQVLVQDRKPVTFEELPDHFVQALLATEDKRFFQHRGYDLRGMMRAARANLLAGGIQQGGSTISQQLTRHVYGLRGRNYSRKFEEIFLARRIEKAYSKDKILEMYVNRIYLGSGCWGVGSAAQAYFGKDVPELTTTESATICGLIKRPAVYSPFVNPDLALEQRNITLGRMAEEGYLPEENLGELQASVLGTLSPEERTQRPHYLLSYIKSETLRLLGNRVLTEDDSFIHTSIDAQIQNLATASLRQGLAEIENQEAYPHQSYLEYFHSPRAERSEKGYLQGAVVVVHHGTGRIVAAVGGRDFSDSQFNRVFQAYRPAGTAFLPLVYAAAFESGRASPGSMVTDAPMDNREVMIGGMEGVLGEWGTEDEENRYEGEVAAAYALLRSKTAASVRVGRMGGLDEVNRIARAAGIRSELLDFPATYLGSSGVSLLELTRAYSTFANGGWVVPDSVTVEKVTRPGGEAVFERSADSLLRSQVVSEVTAAQVSAILQASMSSGPARAACRRYGLSTETVAGKAGSAYGFTDGWFIGFNRDYTCGVWVGFDRPVTIFPKAFGETAVLPIWASIMKQLEVPGELASASGAPHVLLCLKSGALATEHCRDRRGTLAWSVPLAGTPGEPLPPCPLHTEGDEPTRRLAEIPEVPVGIPGAVPVQASEPVVVGSDPYEALPTLSASSNETNGH